MLLEIITPDELLFKGEITHIVLPGLDGSFGILANHAPLISALSNGNVKVEQIVDENKKNKTFNGKLNAEHKEDTIFNFQINGGVVEVSDNKVLVLAE